MATRTRKTPAQRAQEQFELASRAADRACAAANAAKEVWNELEEKAEEALRRKSFFAHHPDLPNRDEPEDQA